MIQQSRYIWCDDDDLDDFHDSVNEKEEDEDDSCYDYEGYDNG